MGEVLLCSTATESWCTSTDSPLNRQDGNLLAGVPVLAIPPCASSLSAPGGAAGRAKPCCSGERRCSG